MSTSTKVTGVVRDGVVVPDEPLDLPDGTPVYLEILDLPQIKLSGIWNDDPGIEAWLREREAHRAANGTSPQ